MPGIYNGVILSRLNTDISLVDFETAVRSLLIDVERAYWDLALAYRDLDAKIAARDATLRTWQFVYRKLQVGAVGGDEENEARVREQFYVLQAQVENAYSGAPPVTAALGSTAGTATVGTSSGVLGAERKLRLLLGVSPTDTRLIRPVTDPARAEVVFDWRSSVNDALTRRLELHRQMMVVRRKELELQASHSFGLPTLDLVGGANYRTFNQDITRIVDPNLPTNGNFNNFNYNAGVTFAVPLGNRIGKTAIRNAELQLARERVVLQEQEKQVINELSGALTELDRAYALMNTNYQRRLAAEQQVAAITRKYEAGATGLDFVLDAQRRWSDAESAYCRAVVDYNRAIAEVHMSRGTLLDYDGILLAEGPSSRPGTPEWRGHAQRGQDFTVDYTFSASKRAQNTISQPPATVPTRVAVQAAPVSAPQPFASMQPPGGPPIITPLPAVDDSMGLVNTPLVNMAPATPGANDVPMPLPVDSSVERTDAHLPLIDAGGTLLR